MLLYNIIFAPIEYIVQFVFLFFYKKFSFLGVGGAIFGVSIVINFLALPLYNIADAIQNKHRETEKKLNPRVKKIKKAFKGDEQFMMLQTYYKQNNYHPLYVLKSSLSILIEIPFFIAAYHYLSNCQELQNQSFLFLKNLGQPDHLLFGINILPILMTLINVVSSAIYTHNTTTREKVQTYALASIFLVLLYNSPSGLVFYWILNNIFSLIKNIVVKMKNPAKVVYYILSSICILITILFLFQNDSTKNKLIVIFVTTLVLISPLIVKLSKLTKISVDSQKISKQNFFIFLISALGCATLFGLLLPSSVINSSPIEFAFMGKTDNPMTYIINSFSIFIGLFIFWPICIYKLFDNKVKKSLPILFFVLLIFSLLNIFIFKSDYGRLNSLLILDVCSNLLKLSWFLVLLPVVCLSILIVFFLFIQKHNKQYILTIITLCLLFATFASSVPKISNIKNTYNNYKKNIAENLSKKNTNNITPYFHLSKDNKNVIVLFLDRAINSYFPKIVADFPEIAKQFDGFTYYPNTLSFGQGTLSGSPAMMGGYEYTPFNMNNRDKELMVTKHNEATLVMPKIFLDASFDVAVSDVPFPNYQWQGDLSAFKPYPEINITEFRNEFNYTFAKEKNITIKDNPDSVCKNNMQYFALMQGLYPPFRNTFYSVTIGDTPFESGYLSQFANLYYLSDLTDFSSQKNTFSFICNETTHQFTFLDENYECPLTLKNPDSTDFIEMSYQVNVAAIKQIGRFLDYLKQNNCYDNTRIIIVADHGFSLNLDIFKDFSDFDINPSSINPLLLVKDFNCRGQIITDTSLMTNADTVLLAIDNLNIPKINPFTKKQLVSQKNNDTITYYSVEASNNDKIYKFNTSNKKYIIKNNIFDRNNWSIEQN